MGGGNPTTAETGKASRIAEPGPAARRIDSPVMLTVVAKSAEALTLIALAKSFLARSVPRTTACSL